MLVNVTIRSNYDKMGLIMWNDLQQDSQMRSLGRSRFVNEALNVPSRMRYEGLLARLQDTLPLHAALGEPPSQTKMLLLPAIDKYTWLISHWGSTNIYKTKKLKKKSPKIFLAQ